MKNQNNNINNLKETLYNDELIGYINSLSNSIKDYYEVSKNINMNKNILINLIEEEINNFKSILDKIIKEKNINKLDYFNNIIENLKIIFNKFKFNVNTEEKNISFFFNDATILFEKLRKKHLESILKNKNKINEKSSTNNTLNFFNSSFKDNIYKHLNMNVKNIKLSDLSNINSIYPNIRKQYFKKINDKYKISKEGNEDTFNTYEYNDNTFKNRNTTLSQNIENIKGYKRDKEFSKKNMSEFIDNKYLRTLSKDKDEIKPYFKEEKNIHKKIIELKKYINIYKNEIEQLKNENIQLQKDNLSIKQVIKENNILKKNLKEIKIKLFKISKSGYMPKRHFRNKNNTFSVKTNLTDSNENEKIKYKAQSNNFKLSNKNSKMKDNIILSLQKEKTINDNKNESNELFRKVLSNGKLINNLNEFNIKNIENIYKKYNK